MEQTREQMMACLLAELRINQEEMKAMQETADTNLKAIKEDIKLTKKKQMPTRKNRRQKCKLSAPGWTYIKRRLRRQFIP
jgi:hypothetical protein